MYIVHQKPRCHRACGLAIAFLLASVELCIGQGPDQSPGVDILGSSSGSSSSSNGGQLMQCTDNIKQQGSLPVAKSWSTDNAVQYNRQQLSAGVCAGYEISAKDLARTACGDSPPDSYILVEFWQLSNSSSSSSSSSNGIVTTPSVPDSVGGHVSDVLVVAAKGVQPWVSVTSDGHIKMTPPLRDADPGVTPVGTFEDDDAMVYGRAVSRMLLPTDAVVVDMGKPLDLKAWYITIANMPGGKPLPGYAIRATCLVLGSSSSSKSKAAAANDMSANVPCPVAVPGDKECSGRGICKSDPLAQIIESSTYCDCDSGFGSWACQLPLPALPINAPTPTVVTIGPGQWDFWEVTLPIPRAGATAGLRNGGNESGTSGDPFAAAAAGLLGNKALMVTAVRIDVDQGFGGKPLLFLKPFMTKDHNEPALDALDSDISKYADLRSYQLPLNKQFILTRLPLQSISTTTSGGSSSSIITYSTPQRWYVAIFNSNSNRLSQPVKVELQVQYRDLNRRPMEPMVCPFNCSGVGKCVDPLASSMGSWPYDGGMLGPMAMGGVGPGGRSGADAASISTAIGPMQDQSPVDAGFMCACDAGFGGLTCEGRVQSVTVGNGEQHLGPETLNPGAWFFYLVTVDQGFNLQSQNLGIQWTVGTPSSPPSNYTNAFISFDQGPMPRQLVSDQRVVHPPAHKPMTPYSKLIVQNNPPLPLQVPGGQLSPGGSYVVSIYNSDFVTRDPYQFTIMFFVVSDQQMVFQPYMSILLGVTAAVILCLAMTLCKRLVMRWGIFPWRWRQRRQQLAAAAAAGLDVNGNSLALVLMAQQQQQQQSNRGVPAEIYQNFPCRPFCTKDFQQRQQDMALQQRRQQQQDDLAASDQTALPAQPAAAAAAAAGTNAAAAADPAAGRLQAGPRFRSVISGLSGLLIHHSAAPQQQAEPPASVQLQTLSTPPPPPPAAAAAGGTVSPAKCVIRANSTAADLATANSADHEVRSVNDLKEGEVPNDELPSCTVCLCEYVADEMVRQLPCGHEFHQCCIDQWMANHGTCPICRAPLWSGAFDPEDTQSESESESNNNNSAAIYVHHDMPSGGFRRSRRSTLSLGVSNRQSNRQSNSVRSSQRGSNIGLVGQGSLPQRLSVDGGGAAAAAGAGVGGVMPSPAVAAAPPATAAAAAAPPATAAAAAAGGSGGGGDPRSSSRFSLSGQPPLSQRLAWQSPQQQMGAVEQVLATPGSAAAQQQQQ